MTDIFDLDEEEFNEMEREAAWNNEMTVAIGGNRLLDGTTTLQEAMDLLEQYISYLQDLEDMGYELEGVVDNGFGVAKVNR